MLDLKPDAAVPATHGAMIRPAERAERAETHLRSAPCSYFRARADLLSLPRAASPGNGDSNHGLWLENLISPRLFRLRSRRSRHEDPAQNIDRPAWPDVGRRRVSRRQPLPRLVRVLAATLPVDAVIGLAPGTGSYTAQSPEKTRDVLARLPAGAKAKRVAAFFFEGDRLEAVEERRAVAIRRGLQQSDSTFVIVDRPPDLYGHSAGGEGRFVRRYRDCLLKFVLDDDAPPGEVQCSRSSGSHTFLLHRRPEASAAGQ